MSWTIPKDWATDEMVTANMMNIQWRDNLNYLFGRPLGYVAYKSAGYATSSGTFVPVDDVNVQLEITLGGTKLVAMCSFSGHRSASYGYSHYAVALNGVIAGDPDWGGAAFPLSHAPQHCTLFGYWEELTPGVPHTATLMYRTGDSRAQTKVENMSTIFIMAWEVG